MLDCFFRAILLMFASGRSVKSEICLNGATLMEWVTPQHEVIELNCEVSSYANAEL